MTPATTWRTDDPCPVCGNGLHTTGNGTDVRQDCLLCGWSVTWQDATEEEAA